MKQPRQARGYPPIQTQQQGQQSTAGALVPQQQGTMAQIPSAFVQLRQRQQQQTVIHCPRCQMPLVAPGVTFCAACGLPIHGCPCPGCSTMLGYFRNYMRKNQEIFWCPVCGTQLKWQQARGGPAYLVIY